MNSDRKIIIIAGPNGAGKTTFAREHLPREAECPNFVNADLIATGLSPFQPEAAFFRAARLMLEEIGNHVQQRRSFAFETTLSGLGYARMIPRWRSDGYTVKLIFLALATLEEAIKRVELRVRQGGHHVPPDVIRRRFATGFKNFKNTYRHIVNYWQWFDNSGHTPTLIDKGENPVTERTREVPASQHGDKETQDVLNALHRAARRAHRIAHQHQTGVVVMRDGKVVEIEPDPEMYCEHREK